MKRLRWNLCVFLSLAGVNATSACVESPDDLASNESGIRAPTAVAGTDLLGIVDVDGMKNCTGAAISTTTVLTAAHCVCTTDVLGSNVCNDFAIVTLRDNPSTMVDDPIELIDGVVTVHPDYNPTVTGQLEHDLAIITYSTPFPSYVTPFIVSGSHEPDDTPLMAVGYGKIGADCETSNTNRVLNFGRGPLDSYEDGHDFLVMDAPQMWCPGDSGGPVLQDDGTLSPRRLLAVISGWQDDGFDTYDLATTTSASVHYSWLASVATLAPDYDPSGVLLEPFFAGVGVGLRIHRVASQPGDKLVFKHYDVDPDYGDTSVANWLSADVNGDGRGDLVQPYFLGAGEGLRIHTVIALPDGTYDFSYDDVDPNYGNPYLVNWKVADVNGDGKDDLVEPFYPGPGPGLRIHKLLSNGSGGWTFSFATVDPNYGNTNLANWKVADINGDGRDDLVEPWHAGPTIGLRIHSVLATSSGGWTFSYQNVNSGYGTTDMVYWRVGDVNGDGRDDLIEPHYLNPGLRIHKIVSGSSSSASWTFSYIDVTNSYTASTLANWKVGDINADGRADLLEPYYASGLGLRVRSAIALASGAWTFTSSPVNLNYSNSNLSRWKVMDFDGDERADLVEPTFVTGQGLRINYTRSTGTGSFVFDHQDVNPVYGNTGLTKWVVGGLEPRVTQ